MTAEPTKNGGLWDEYEQRGCSCGLKNTRKEYLQHLRDGTHNERMRPKEK